MLPGYGAFITLLKEAFKPADKTRKAMNKLYMIKQGNRLAEELVTKFRLLAGQANLGQTSPSNHLHLIRLFCDALNPSLAKWIMNADQVPTTITKWFDKAIQYDTNFQMAQAIMNQGKGKMPNRWTPQGQTQNQGQWDPNAMDIRALTPDERSKLMRSGSCFRCQKQGHMARDCPGPEIKGIRQMYQRNGPPKTWVSTSKGLKPKKKKN